jgi:hypothetical protein
MPQLGRSSIQVTPLCLGGNVFGWTTDEETSFKVLDTYKERLTNTQGWTKLKVTKPTKLIGCTTLFCTPERETVPDRCSAPLVCKKVWCTQTYSTDNIGKLKVSGKR